MSTTEPKHIILIEDEHDVREATKLSLELAGMKVEDFEHDGIYKAGDIIGFGELVCQQCDEKIHIMHVSEVAVCAKCGGESFTRLPLDP